MRTKEDIKKVAICLVMLIFSTMSVSAQTEFAWSSNEDWTREGDGITLTQTGCTVSVDQAEGTTTPVVNAAKLDLRAYAKNTMTITAAAGTQFTEIVFTISAQGKKRLGQVAVDKGAVTYAEDYSTVTWNGEATNQLTITIGDYANYGTDGESKAQQFCVDSPILISTSTADGTIPFADSAVKALCVANWDTNGDGELSYAEAAAVKKIGTVFRLNTEITTFDELQYFTGLKSINYQMFLRCTSLTSVKIPESVTEIGSQSFYNCSNLTFVNIPEGVTSIYQEAFGGCRSLTSIIIPKSVTEIDKRAFSGCTNLTSFAIPENVTSIGESAFYGCKSLISVNIPESVTEIGINPFASCSGLEQIMVEGGNMKYDSRDNCNAIIETASNTLIAGCDNTTIPNSVITIGKNAFVGCTQTSVSIPNSVTYIGSFAFNNCIYLTSVNIPNRLISIGEKAFQSCRSLTSVNIPESVTEIGIGAFNGCTRLTSVIVGWETPISLSSNTTFTNAANATLFVPKGTKAVYEAVEYWKDFKEIVEVEIGNIVFADSKVKEICVANWDTNGDGELSYAEAAIVTSLGTVFQSNTEITTFDELQYFTGLTSINNYAFFGCTGLTSINIPHSVTSIGSLAFCGCRDLNSIIIPEGITVIGRSSFGDCTKLTSITLPVSVVEIQRSAFSGCTGLTSVVFNAKKCTTCGSSSAPAFPSTIITLTIGDEAEIIPSYAFQHCEGLTSVSIPNSVTEIGTGAFAECTGLTSVSIPNSVTSIGRNAFYDCTGLTSVTIGNSVTLIDDEAFRGCTGLTSVSIPNSVTEIGTGAFFDCTGLTSVTIGNSVTLIGNVAFQGCTGLESIVVEDGNTKYDSRENCNAIIETISNMLLVGCKSTIIPNDVTSIGKRAFFNCEGLTSVSIPNSVTSIGKNAFYDCTGLTSVTIGNSVTLIDDDAFRGCTGLTSVNIPHSVTSIGWDAFYDCTGLTSVTIGNSVTSIGFMAFCGCDGLTSVIVGWDTPIVLTYDYIFTNVANATLYVPMGTKATYETAEYWKDFKEIVELDDTGVTLVDGMAFTNDAETEAEELTYTRTFSNTEWQALYVPFEMAYSEWQADFDVARLNNVHQYDDDEDGTVDRTILEAFHIKSGATTANTPYLIRAKSVGEKTITLENATLYKAEKRSIDCSSIGTKFTFTGTYSGISGTDMFANGYYAMGSGSLHQAESSANNLSPMRWYMTVTDRNGNPMSLGEVKVMVFGDDADGIDLTPALSQGEGETAVYDLSGRRTGKPMKKGVYIKNGRKYVVK